MADEGTATVIEIDTTIEVAPHVEMADEGTATGIEIDTTIVVAPHVETADEGTDTCIEILVVVAIFLPPLGVFLKFGFEDEFWICLLLTFFGHLPGIIYAIYAITK